MAPVGKAHSADQQGFHSTRSWMVTEELLNRVLAAGRSSQAQLVEARTKSRGQRIEPQNRAEAQRREAEANAHAQKLAAEAAAEAKRNQTLAGATTLKGRAQAAQAYTIHPVLLRLGELPTLRQLASSGNARAPHRLPKGQVRRRRTTVRKLL